MPLDPNLLEEVEAPQSNVDESLLVPFGGEETVSPEEMAALEKKSDIAAAQKAARRRGEYFAGVEERLGQEQQAIAPLQSGLGYLLNVPGQVAGLYQRARGLVPPETPAPAQLPPTLISPEAATSAVRFMSPFRPQPLGSPGQAVEELIGETAAGLTSPENLALMAAGVKAPVPVTKTFQAGMLAGVPGQVEQAIEAPDTKEQIKGALGAAAGLVLPLAMQRGLRPPPTRIPPVTGEMLPMPPGAEPPPVLPVDRPRVPRAIVPETLPEPERAMNVIQEIRAKGLDTKEKIRSVFPQLTREEAARLRDQAFPKEKGPADARRVEEAAAVYGDLRAQPEQGPPQVPVEEGGPGVQPQAPPGVQPAEIVLSEHGKPVFAELQRLAASGAEGWGTADALDLGDQLKNPEDIAAVKKWVEQKRAEIRNQIASLPKTIQTMGQKGRLAVLSQKLQEVIEGAEKPADKSHVQRHFAEKAHPKLAGIEFQPENWRVTITAPEVYGAKGEKTPGSAQYDLVESGKNIDSASPEAMKGLGHDVPTREELMKLPSGRYTFAEAKAKLAELAKKGGEKIEEEKRPKEGVLAPEPSAPAPSPAPAAAAPETAAPPGVPVPAAPAPAVPGSMEEIANLRRAIFTGVGQTYRVYLKKATPEEVQSKLWLISDALTKVESLIDRLKKEGKPLGILVDTKQSLYSFKEVLQKSKKSRAPAPPPATPAAPAPAPPAPAEPTPAAPQDLKAVWEQFDGTGEIETARDLADHVERLISEGKAPQSLQGAVDAYREALREDFEEMGGRGDTETAEEEFTEAVRSAAGRTPPSPKPSGGASELDAIVPPKDPSDPRYDSPGITRKAKPNSLIVQLRDLDSVPIREIVLPSTGDPLADSKLFGETMRKHNGDPGVSMRESAGISTGDNGLGVYFFNLTFRGPAWTSVRQLIEARAKRATPGEKLTELPTPPPPAPAAPAPAPPAPTEPTPAPPEAPPTASETPAEQAARMPPPPPGLEKLSADVRKAANAHQKALNDLEAHKLTEPPEGAPGQEVVEHNRTRIALAAGERKAEAAYNAALSEYSLAKWRASVPKSAFTPSKPPTITNKVLKTQKENLLQQLDDAIRDAPETAEGKITIDVPGDGTFTVINRKSTLKAFRDTAKKQFPATVPTPGTPGLPTIKPRAMAPVAPPEPEDLGKIVVPAMSTDEARFAITTGYADGTQIVATDGRQLVRIVTPDAPGKPDAPVRINDQGKVDAKAATESKYPNWKAVTSGERTLLRGGVDTKDLFHIARQAQVLRDTTEGTKAEAQPVELWLNRDGSLGGKMTMPGGEGEFEHNMQPGGTLVGGFNPDYLLDAANVARRLNNERVDLFRQGETPDNPLVIRGQNHEHLIMPIRLEGRPAPENSSKFTAVAGRPTTPSLPEGLGPLEDPMLPRSTIVAAEGAGRHKLTLEGDTLKIEKHGTFKNYRGQMEDTWTTVAEPKVSELGKTGGKSFAQILKEANQPIGAANAIKQGFRELMKEREDLQAEAKARKGTPPPPGPGAQALGITPPGYQAFLKVAGRLDRIRQSFVTLGRATPERKMMDQRFDAADNMAVIAGATARRSLEIGTTPLDRRAAVAIVESGGDRRRLRHFLIQARGKNDQAVRAIQHADANWARLQPLALRAKRFLDEQIQRENANGINTQYMDSYVPHIHDMDLLMGGGRPFVISGRGSGITTSFEKGRTFETYFDAIEARYTPKSMDIGELVEHRVKVGERLINRRDWALALRDVLDPTDGKSIVTDVQHHSRGPGQPGWESVPQGYVIQDVIPGLRVGVHGVYAKLFDAMAGRSNFTSSLPMQTLLEGEGFIKHGLLLFDTFHASRIMQRQLALTGRVGWEKGVSLLEYNNRDLARAVQANLITPQMEQWIRSNRPTAQLLIREGLNVGRVQEALYNNWVRKLPDWTLVPIFNRWVFDKVTRGAIMESALSEYRRVSGVRPELTPEEVARTVSRNLNAYFGNLGRQGVFKSRSAQDVARIFFLAPQWVESMARTEVIGAAQAVKGLTYDPIVHQTILVGSLGKGLAQGIAAYMIGAQILNLVTRGKFTWQNEEKDHKLDAFIPDFTGKSPGFFLSPLSTQAELTHDLIRYNRTEPSKLAAAVRVMSNKTSPLWRAGKVLLTGEEWNKTQVIDSWDRAKAAGVALVPTPIPLSTLTKPSAAPGSLQRQLTASAGFKTEPAASALQQTAQDARDFMRTSSNPRLRDMWERQQKEHFESDYRPLRQALQRNDPEAAVSELKKLEPAHPPAEIARAFRESARRPFTGSTMAERQFLASLDQKGREQYRQARRQQVTNYQRFLEALRASRQRQNAPAPE